VTIFDRSPRGAVTPASRGRVRLALAATLAALALLASAGPAQAVLKGGFGVQTRAGVSLEKRFLGGPLDYHGGPVLHSSDVYVVFWDPHGAYRGDWERLVDRFFQDVGAESGHRGDVFALDGQYSDAGGRAANQLTFRGSVKDTDPYPTIAEGGNCTEKPKAESLILPLPTPICLTDRQIKAELQHVITSVAPPLPGASGTPIYYLLTPPGVNVCTDGGSAETCAYSKALDEEMEKTAEPPNTGLCGYHGVIGGETASPIPYVVQPWTAGYAGLFITNENPLETTEPTSDVLSCQDARGLEEPNQLTGLNPFGNFAEGLGDVIINDLSIEQRNVVTNPLLNGWYQTSTTAEQGDMTQYNFGPPPQKPPTPNKETHAASEKNEVINGDPYYLSWAFDSAEFADSETFSGWAGVALEPFFTAPNPVNSGDIVGFNGTESDITLDAPAEGLPADEPYAPPSYAWNFGDGSAASGIHDASVFHTYQYGGKYDVTLTITDSGGNVETTDRPITVNGPPPPGSPGAPGGPGSGSTAGSPGGSSGGSSANGNGGTPAPVATDAVISRKLRTVMKTGVIVRYSVNEQVAGRFEILLGRALAARLGISGTSAVGLPAGSAPALVIGKALVVTTSGGRNTLHISLTKRTAQRLARLGRATLTLRLIVHNAARTPATTTVLSTFTLTR